jgi:EpsI family protein
MGGKDSILVDETADVDSAAQGIVAAAFGFQGQKCSACSRAIVVDDVYDEVLEKVVAGARRLTQGDPADRAKLMGAVIDEKAFGKIREYIGIGRQEGRHVRGGDVRDPDESGAAGGWAPAEAGSLPEWKPLYGGVAAESTTTWGKDGTVVGLFLGYYRNQQPGRELITSENKVIRSKDPDWTLAGYGEARAPLPQGPSTVSSTEIRGDRGRLLVWRWYSIGGHVTARDYVAKALLVLAKLVGRGDDSAVVMVYTTVREDGRADAARALSDFVGAMGPAIEHSLAEAAAH